MPPVDWCPEDTDMRVMMSWHLSGNFYPPLPQAYVEPAVRAYELCAQGDHGETVVIPKDIDPVPAKATAHDDGWHITAGALADALRLDIP